MARVSEWLGLYMWMQNERLQDVEAKVKGHQQIPRERAQIIAALTLHEQKKNGSFLKKVI